MRKLLLILAFAACAQQRVATQPQAADVAAGQKLFEQHCAACHGANAAGTKYAPDLTNVVHAMDSEELFRFVTNGNLRHGMPAWSRLPEQRRWQIVAFLKCEGRP